MGLEIDKSSFTPQEFSGFYQRLQSNLQALKALLQRPGFGAGPGSIGAELELCIVDRNGHPLMVNSEIQQAQADPRLTLELNRYNLEYNLTPVPISGTPFSRIETEIRGAIAALEQSALAHEGHILAIGILPTLRRRDFGPHVMTEQQRYKALTDGLSRIRGERIQVRINGDEPISLRARDVTLEGANTSLQLHYRVLPENFADTYNAMQLATPVVLALAGNSPFLLGHRLWHETRIPLFKHAIDGAGCNGQRGRASRVNLGTGWVRDGAYELFAESALLHAALLPVCQQSEDDMQAVRNGDLPKLHELRLHQGTIWPWNRVIYDDSCGGHLRIEMRALPAGPTACDMMANAAFLIGLAEGLRTEITELMPALPFSMLEHNFYRSAEFGLGTQLLWPSSSHRRLEEVPVTRLARSLLPVAAQGLGRIGIGAAESEHYLGIIEQRLECGRTGARWQLGQVSRLNRRLSRHRALKTMLEGYRVRAEINQPVAQWTDMH
ncbi:glutamate--cysteine ligase [Marinobacterium rhizophilum]|uniref:Glutamate--cysteine ligase n=1 Tax=Marinobacterium rhizophilum TaxID=420402 RepID=A0ABY5HJT7_9GAMM|nr:glutamate--cysteine ligase [Marinobacterium rhizophilum]UTW11539.1 glutamate--cysteine ligase [Marinobacterium rhizophilum]